MNTTIIFMNSKYYECLGLDRILLVLIILGSIVLVDYGRIDISDR
jgi:hypothetical protein